MDLTKKQREILNFIIEFIRDNDYSPSYQEIADHFGLSSRATVHQHIQTLVQKGYLNAKGGVVRSVEPAKNIINSAKAINLPLVGLITAGQPIEAVETKEVMAVPQELTRDPANSYVLRVKGDSMIEDGILDGDYVVVQRNPSPKNGDVVVALLSNEYATLKRFYREKNRVRLQPANSTMKPIFTKDPLIQGVVQAVIRRFATI